MWKCVYEKVGDSKPNYICLLFWNLNIVKNNLCNHLSKGEYKELICSLNKY